MKRLEKRKALLLGLLLIAALVLSGCYSEPESIPGGSNSGYNGGNVYPQYSNVPSAAPTNTPAPGVSDQPSGPIIVKPSSSQTPGSGTGFNTPIISKPSSSAAPVVITPTATKTATPAPTSSVLKEGSTGSAVRSLQSQLKKLGYLKGSVDGDFGAATKEAVIAFQKANKLTADGVAGARTLEKLASSKAATAKPTASPTPRPTATPKVNENTYLKLGSSGSDVTKMQNKLIELGYLSGSATGKFDETTEAAVIAFQKRNMSYSDGIAGYQTLTKLYSSSAKKASTSSGVLGLKLKEGVKNSAAVKTLQRRLKALEYYSGSIDGNFGSGTTAAVKAFQAQNGLNADGVAGSKTLSKLFGDDAKKASAATVPPSSTAKPNYTNPPSYTNVTSPPSGSDYITLEIGDSGSLVKKLQSALKKAGYYNGSVDGRYGSSTAGAVTAFQKAKGLKQDGKAGPATQRVLYEGDFPKEA